jgi:hypothetical protein
MLVNEVTNRLKTFLGQNKAGGITVRTTIDADNMSQARAIRQHLYGVVHVYSVTKLQTLTNEAGNFRTVRTYETSLEVTDLLGTYCEIAS